MKSFLVRCGFVLALFGVIGLLVAREDLRYAFSEPVDINEEYPEDYYDVKAVKTDVFMLLDCFAELETTKKQNGAITGRDYTYYYIMPVFTEDETYYVAVQVDEDDDKAYDHIADLTWEYFLGEESDFGYESVAFEGGFVKMEDKLYKYYTEWFEEAEWFENKAEMEQYALPLVLKPAILSRTKGFILGAAGFILVAVIMLIFGFLPSKKKEIPAPVNSTIEINGVNYPISNFENVNKDVVAGKKVQAIKKVQEITGLELAEAKAVVDNWNQYWC